MTWVLGRDLPSLGPRGEHTGTHRHTPSRATRSPQGTLWVSTARCPGTPEVGPISSASLTQWGIQQALNVCCAWLRESAVRGWTGPLAETQAV